MLCSAAHRCLTNHTGQNRSSTRRPNAAFRLPRQRLAKPNECQLSSRYTPAGTYLHRCSYRVVDYFVYKDQNSSQHRRHTPSRPYLRFAPRFELPASVSKQRGVIFTEHKRKSCLNARPAHQDVILPGQNEPSRRGTCMIHTSRNTHIFHFCTTHFNTTRARGKPLSKCEHLSSHRETESPRCGYLHGQRWSLRSNWAVHMEGSELRAEQGATTRVASRRERNRPPLHGR